MGDFGGFDPGSGPPDQPPVLFGIDLSAVINLINQVIALLVAIANFLYSLILALVKALVAVFKSLGKFLKHVWTCYIKTGIKGAWDHLKKLRGHLKCALKAIIKRLEKIKKWYDDHILKQQLRFIQMIQRIRRFLGILRLFHIKWAATLDNVLVDLQNRIEHSIAITRGILNQIISTLALVFDPTLVIRRNALGASLLSNLGAIKRIFGYGDGRILSASEQRTIEHQHSLYFKETVTTHLQTVNESGPTEDDKANRTAARKALTEATNAALPF
jgi:phage-related protein